jgi:glutamyl-tRNA reductase
VADVAPHAVYLHGPAAVRHLCRVACGLDAAILGEAQVLAQVAGAIRQSVAAHAATPLLKDVFRSAVTVGERARRAVWAGYRAADIGSASADGADERLGGLAGVGAVVVGAGEVAELALRALHARSVGRLTVLNRSLERGEQLAERHGADAAGLDALPIALREADVVVVATGAPSIVVDVGMVQDALAARPDRPLVIVDAALPRNVDPAVRALAGAHLLDLNDLRPLFARASDERHDAIAAVEALIEGEVHALVTRRKSWRGAASSTARPVGETPWLASA